MVQTVDNLITENAKVVHDLHINALSVNFNGFIPFKQMEQIIQHEFEMIQCFKLKKCLVDLRAIKVYAPGSQELIKNVWFPRVKKEGMQYVAFVVPEDMFAQASMNKAHDETGENSMQTQYFKDLDAARTWLVQAN